MRPINLHSAALRANSVQRPALSNASGPIMDHLRDKYIALIAEAADENTLEDLRVQAVGKKGDGYPGRQ